MSIGKLTSRYTLHLTMVAQAITSPRDVTRVRHYKPAVTLPSDESMSIGEVAGVYSLCYVITIILVFNPFLLLPWLY
jgi:hypothetical protein